VRYLAFADVKDSLKISSVIPVCKSCTQIPRSFAG
jgi:hypothetical protein